MEQKRKARLERIKQEDPGAAANFQRLKQRLLKTNERAGKHAKALKFLRAFQRKNERLFLEINQRLLKLEKALGNEAVPTASIKDELVGMLQELGAMKEHRQRILERTGNA